MGTFLSITSLVWGHNSVAVAINLLFFKPSKGVATLISICAHQYSSFSHQQLCCSCDESLAFYTYEPHAIAFIIILVNEALYALYLHKVQGNQVTCLHL